MSDTPLTDKQARERTHGIVDADFARELERDYRATQKALKQANDEKREMWKAMCQHCKLYNSNGAGRACLARNWQTPTMSTCPLLKKKGKEKA